MPNLLKNKKVYRLVFESPLLLTSASERQSSIFEMILDFAALEGFWRGQVYKA